MGGVNHGAGVDSRTARVGWDGVVVGEGKIKEIGIIVWRLGNNDRLVCPAAFGLRDEA